MLSLEDLADLGDALREAGFRVAMQQYFDAQQLLLKLAAAGALPQGRTALEPYLAPLFCKSAIEQQRFGELYGRWARRDELPPPPPPLPAKRSWRVRFGPPALKLAAFAALIIIALGAWQHYRPRVVQGVVLDDKGRPAFDAAVLLGGKATKTDAGGKFRLTVTAAQLPATVAAADKSKNTVAKETLGIQFSARPQLAMWRHRLYLYATDWSAALDVTLRLSTDSTLPIGRVDPDVVNGLLSSPNLLAQAGARLDPSIGPPTLRQRVDGRNAAWTLLPLLLFGAWALWRLRRRPALRRIASRTPASMREVHLPGGMRELLPGLPLRRLAQELRRRRLVDSSELQAEATIRATLRRGGVFTPVRGSRVEPEYLALVDRASLSDHLALLADQLLADLTRSDVLIERYDFDGDASRCRRREPFDAAARRAPAPRRERLQTVALAELRERHPEHRVIVFSEGAGCFNAFTGAPSPWLETLLEWASPVLITPLPPERWARREWALEQLGVTVLPLSQTGMLALMGLLGGAPSLERARDEAQRAADAPPHERSPSQWLERRSPDAAAVDALCAGLRSELGERGFSWLAGCAAYPEIHWGITLRLPDALVPDRAERERLMPRIARLPWFREGFMPDWLRKALLSRMDPGHENLARGVITKMLEDVTLEPHGELPLRIAVGAPPAADRTLRGRLRDSWHRLRDAWRRLRARGRLRHMLRAAPPESPMRDVVFLQFIHGERIGGLSLRAPGAFLRTLMGYPRRNVSTPIIALVVSVTASAVVALQWPPVYLGSAESRPVLLKWSRADALSVMSVVEFGDQERLMLAPKAAWVRPQAGQAPEVSYFPVRLLTDGKPGAGALSSDGNILALGYDDGKVRTVTTESTSARTFKVGGPADEVKVLAFGDGAGLLAAAAGNTIVVWDLDTGAEETRITEKNIVTSLAFAPGGRLLAAGTKEGALRVWRVGASPSPSAQLEPDGDGAREITALAYSPDGTTLAIGNDRGTIMLWSPSSGHSEVGLPSSSQSSQIFQLAFQPAGSVLAAVENGRMRLLDVQSWALRPGPYPQTTVPGIHASDRGLSFIAFSPDGRQLAALDESRGVRLYGISSSAASASARRAAQVPADFLPGRSLAVLFADNPKGEEQVEGIADLLRSRYGFGAEVVGDPVRWQPAFMRLIQSATPEDRVLIYMSSSPSPFDARDLQQTLQAIRAREVLVVMHSQWAELPDFPNARPRNAGAVRLLLRSSAEAFPLAFQKALVSGPPQMTASQLRDAVARALSPSGVSLERLRAAGDNGGGDFSFGEAGREQRRPAAGPSSRR